MDLADWRSHIDTVDKQLIDLLNERMKYCLEIGEIKRLEGRQVQDEDRERAVLATLTQYNKGPMSNEAIVDIFTRIIAEARNLES
jgi:chorismate mutase